VGCVSGWPTLNTKLRFKVGLRKRGSNSLDPGSKKRRRRYFSSHPFWPDVFVHDTETGILPGIPGSAICVQRFDDSLASAIHITYRISLRSSSMREPRDPLLKVVFDSTDYRESRRGFSPKDLKEACLREKLWQAKVSNPPNPQESVRERTSFASIDRSKTTPAKVNGQ
jgi:hypothetical protein